MAMLDEGMDLVTVIAEGVVTAFWGTRNEAWAIRGTAALLFSPRTKIKQSMQTYIFVLIIDPPLLASTFKARQVIQPSPSWFPGQSTPKSQGSPKCGSYVIILIS